jgi:mycothiol system anti-sigma-R factor
MSCGKHHDVDCSQILERVYVFIDDELATADCQQIQQHLDECGPCLREVDLERVVKALVARSCAESAPVELRQRVMFSIRQVQLEISDRRLDLG